MQSERRLLQLRIARLVVSVPTVTDDELRAELTKYLCVLLSGLIEVSARDILSRYASRRSSPQVARYVAAQLEFLQSAKVRNLTEAMAAFDPNAAQLWRRGLTDEQVDSIDSIVSNRHQIAHGRSIGLSFSVLDGYRKNAELALVAMETAFPSFGTV
jgi:hypothetical protein